MFCGEIILTRSRAMDYLFSKGVQVHFTISHAKRESCVDEEALRQLRQGLRLFLVDRLYFYCKIKLKCFG